MEDREYMNEHDEEVLTLDLSQLFRKLKPSWRRIAVWSGVAFATGILIAFSIPRSYTATAELAPELATGSASKLGSITNMLGLSNMMNSTDAVYPALYPKMVHSTPFSVQLLSSTVTMKTSNGPQTCTLQDYIINHTRRTWWGAAFKGGRDLFRSKDETMIRDTIDPYNLTDYENTLIEQLNSMVEVSVDKKTMAVTLQTTAQDPYVAADLCNSVNTLLQQTVTNYRTNKSKQDLAYYESLYEEAKTEYRTAQSNYAHYVDGHQGVVLLSVRAEQDRLQNEMNLKYQIYNNIANELQGAKAKVQLETPIFAEIVPPTVPLKPSKPKKKVIAAIFLILGLAGGCADVLFWHKKEDDNHTDSDKPDSEDWTAHSTHQ
ncbi:MAG: lipopolysaccharide biosynthesis protein [bacterium P3]|nr:MAG: lipopolysaccharide biosynthesis protein [bacterium P3]KWW42321.1 MAG: lipopolysaccharide biosynthesis protein [bacterium F083]